jgi:hypothetical protein
LVLAMSAGAARAGEGFLRDQKFSMSLLLLAHYDNVDEPTLAGGLEHAGTVGARLRGMVGKAPGWCAGFDFEVGGADEGFVYELDVYLAGLGMRLGGGGMVAVCAGAGFGGTTGAIPFAGQFPVEGVIELDIATVRVMTWARATWTVGADQRANGASVVTFADEVAAGVGFRVGKRMRPYGNIDAGNGYYVGGTYRESMGTRFVGAVFGYGISGGAN